VGPFYLRPSNSLFVTFKNPNLRVVTGTIATFLIAFTFIGCWAICRYTKRAGDTLMNVHIGTFHVCMISFLFVSRAQTLPYDSCFIAGALSANMLDTNLKRLYLSLAAIGDLLIAVDGTLVEKEYIPPLLLPGFMQAPNFIGMCIRHAISFLGAYVCYALNSAQQEEYLRHLLDAQYSLEMAQTVSDKLVSFDTSGAQVVLNSAKQKKVG